MPQLVEARMKKQMAWRHMYNHSMSKNCETVHGSQIGQQVSYTVTDRYGHAAYDFVQRRTRSYNDVHIIQSRTTSCNVVRRGELHPFMYLPSHRFVQETDKILQRLDVVTRHTTTYVIVRRRRTTSYYFVRRRTTSHDVVRRRTTSCVVVRRRSTSHYVV